MKTDKRYKDLEQAIDGYIQLAESKPRDIPESSWPNLIDLFQQKLAGIDLGSSPVPNPRELLAMQVDDVAAPSSSETILEAQRQALNVVSDELTSLGIGADYSIIPLTKKEDLDFVGGRVPIFSSGEMCLFTSVFIKDNHRNLNVLLSRDKREISGEVLSQMGFDERAKKFVPAGRQPRIVVSQSLRLASWLYSSLFSECLHYSNNPHQVDWYNALLTSNLIKGQGVGDPMTQIAGLARVIEEGVTHGITAHFMVNTILPLQPSISDMFWQDWVEKLDTIHYKGIKPVIALVNSTSRRYVLDQYRNNYLTMAQYIVNSIPEFKQHYT